MRERGDDEAALPGAAADSLVARLRRAGRGVARAARLMIGQPDYEAYVAHCRAHHPQRAPMTRDAFFRNRLEARYAGGGGRGCC